MGIIIPNMGTKKLNISDALFSKVKQKVLGILYSKPETAFFTNEIIRLSHTGTGAVQRELEKLAAAGLATTTVVGNQKRYQANKNNPLYNELRSIVLKTFGIADVILKALSPIQKNILLGFIYGSIAKHEETSNSDIDLMIISDKLSYADCFQRLIASEKKIARKINPTIYTSADWSAKSKDNNNFIKQVIKQPKIFLIGSQEQLNELS